MLDLDPFAPQPERCGSDASLLYVPFMPGANLLRAYLSSVGSEERRTAIDELAGIGQVLHELVGQESPSVRSFHGLPQEYQDWIVSLIVQVLTRLRRSSHPSP